MNKSELEHRFQQPNFTDRLYKPNNRRRRDYGDPKKAMIKRRIEDIKDKQAFEKLWGEL